MQETGMNVAIVGAGAVSLLTAYELVLSNKVARIVIFDKPENSIASATYAAGAMEAVIGEVEHGFEQDQFQLKLIENGLMVRHRWDQIDEEIGLNLFTADETIVFLNEGANDFEKKNYQAVVNAAEKFDGFEFVNPNEYFCTSNIKPKESVIKLKRERAFDPRVMIKRLREKLIFSGTEFKNEEVISIDPNSKEIQTSMSVYPGHLYDYIIISAGASSSNLFPEETGIVPLIHGIGTALLCKSEKYTDFVRPRTVYRSVNRGGSQCGLHLVPNTESEFYIGAGNQLSWNSDKSYRFDTIRYLMNELEDDLFGASSMYSIKGDILRGNRARSADYLPLVGPLSVNSDIIFATGFNRIGLTMAPLIAGDVLNFIKGKTATYFSGYLPDRELVSYGEIATSSNSFAEVTCANLIEHNLLEDTGVQSKKQELVQLGYDLNKKANIAFDLPDTFGHTPDALSVLAKYVKK